jgi:ADP-heptose:LPS heptosyltransferase
MSNILIIKHGSLGDLIQANGAIQDIKNSFKTSKVLLLTSRAYLEFMSSCPYIDGVILDKRLPRWNLFYLKDLKKLLEKYEFSHVFDLQNSTRTKFYKKYLLKKPIWSSSETSLDDGEKLSDFNQESVLTRMKKQLQKSNVPTKNTQAINLNWSIKDISRNLKQYTNGEYVLIFPFCSKKHVQKKWPYFSELIVKIKEFYKNKYPVLVAPGPNEIDDAKKLNAKLVLDKNQPVDISFLVSLINSAKYIVSNDTGPAHICSHLNKKGIALFGSHTTAKKVNIGNTNFKALTANNLAELKVNDVLSHIKKDLN